VIAPGDDMPTAMLNIVESFTASEKRQQLKGYVQRFTDVYARVGGHQQNS
jgi:hypothetical protein